MISLIFIVLAAIGWAFIDTLAHHFDKSVFFKLNRYFWDASVSWIGKYELDQPMLVRKKWRLLKFKLRGKSYEWKINKPVQFTDAWHPGKSATIIFFICAVVFYKPIIAPWPDIIIYGTAFNLTFSLFYDKIFIR